MAKAPTATTTTEPRTYTFTTVCKSGATKEAVITASTFVEARKKLAEFVDAN